MESEHLKSLIIECLAEANPPPSYVWTNAAGGIETHGRFLTVQNVDDLDGSNYTYTCTATNILGFDKRSVLFKITRRFYHDMYFKILMDKKEKANVSIFYTFISRM